MTITSAQRRNPFVGPRPFEPGEMLYGRDREARELLALLIAERIVLLYSPSGAGKTSLVQAALIPRLTARDFFVRPIIRVNLATAAEGNRYSLAMLSALEEGLPAAEQTPLADLAALSLDTYLNQHPPPAEADGEVLILDQFEEILTADPSDEAGRMAFFAELGAALRNRNRWALFMLREDYIAGLDPYLLPIPTRLNNTYRLDLLSVPAAAEVMRGLAGAAGVPFVPEAAEQLATNLSRTTTQRADGTLVAQPGLTVEPVQLQIVGYRLWERLSSDATQIGAAEVADLGDVDQALGDYYADQVGRAAGPSGVPERAIRQWFERRLITPQGIRGTVLAGAQEAEGLPIAAVAPLRNAYLVRGERRRGATWLELAHDRLVAPVLRNNAAWFNANLSTLQRQTDLWAEQGRPDGLLLRGAALHEAEQWATANPDALTAAEHDLLARSRAAERQARRVRNLAIGATVLAIVATLAFVTALLFFNRAEMQRREAERQAQINRARELAAAAVSNLPRDPLLSLILARESVETTRTVGEPVVAEAEAALQQAVQASRTRWIVTPTERGFQDLVAAPDGTALFTTGNDGVLRRFTADGAETWQIQAGDPALDQPALGLAVSPDGALVAAGVGATVVIYAAAAGTEVSALEGHSDDLLSLAFSPDGATLASAGYDGLAILWDVATGDELLAIEASEVEVFSVAFSPDGTQLATATGDGVAVVWDATDGSELFALEGHTGAVQGVIWHPAGEQIATVSSDLTARIWDAQTGAPLDVLRGHTGAVERLSYSPQGDLLATAAQDGTIRLWAADDALPVLTLAGHANAVTGTIFSPDGATLTSVGFDGTLRQWDLGLAPVGGAYLVAISPDGTILATAGVESVTLWDLLSGARLRDIALPTEATALSWAPDSTLLAVGDIDGLISLIDASAGVTMTTLEDHTGQINRLAFSPDGSLLASVSDDGSALVWDVAGGGDPVRFAGHADAVTALAWAPDGAALASGDVAGTLIIWTPDGVEQQRMPLVAGEVVLGLAFSPDGAQLAAADEGGLLALFDPASDDLIREVDAGGPIYDLAYRPGAPELATVGRAATARIWDVADLTLLRSLPHPAEIYSLAFSPDGVTLATAAADGVARIFPLELDDLLALAAQRAVRPPTAAECAVYRLVTDCPVGTP